MNTILIVAYILFATLVYGIYLLLPKKARPFCLLFFSFAFYILYSKFMTIFLVLTILTVYLGGVGINKMNAKYMFNSNDNTNNNSLALFPVASILLWLYNYKLYKGRIETNYVPLLFSKVIKSSFSILSLLSHL